MKAIDVSGWQHPNGRDIDYHAVAAAGIEAVWIKATEGTRWQNDWLPKDALGFADAGLKVGYYHFAHPGDSDAGTQFDWFWRHISMFPRAIGVALDYEIPPISSGWARSWLHDAAQYAEYTTLYCNRSYLSGLTGAPFGHRLWLASPGDRPRQEVWAWQYGTGTVPGIVTPVDLDWLADDDYQTINRRLPDDQPPDLSIPDLGPAQSTERTVA